MKGRGQITIFIVVGILLISSIVFFFLYRQGIIPSIGEGKEINPNSFLEACLEERVDEVINTISMQGGNFEPQLYKTFKFDDDAQFWNISYLCYTSNYFVSCVNNEPILMSHIEKEIKSQIEGDVQDCLAELNYSLENQNYEVESFYGDTKVNLAPRKIEINVETEIDLKKNDEGSKLKNFKIVYPSTIYDLASVTYEIVAQESEFCYFNYNGYMLMYPDYNIEVYNIDATRIYTIKLRDNQDTFRFAVQGCRIG